MEKQTTKKLSQKDKEKVKMEIFRTKLSLKQTQMSCERSLLSYIRTACVFVSLAFAYLKVASHDNFDWFVIIMFVIGGAFLAFGIVEYRIILHKQKRISKHLTNEYMLKGITFDEDEL